MFCLEGLAYFTHKPKLFTQSFQLCQCENSFEQGILEHSTLNDLWAKFMFLKTFRFMVTNVHLHVFLPGLYNI